MPTAFKCAGSIRPCELEINETNEAAETGTAAHACFEGLVSHGEIDWDGINNACDLYGGNSEEVRMLCGRATRMWPKIRESFPGALTEIETHRDLSAVDVAGSTLTGHVDLISIVGLVARIADWKTGRKDTNYSQQMRAYMAMILMEFPELERSEAFIIWVRTEEIESYSMTREEAHAWIADLEDRIVNWDGVYRPGDHCGFCRRRHECSAGNALSRSYVAAVAGLDLGAVEASIANMIPDEAIDLYHKCKLVERVAGKCLAALKARANEGDIEGTQTRLTIEHENRREIDFIKAWGVLESLGFGDADYAAVAKLSMSKIEKRCAERAPKGEGNRVKRQVAGMLEAAGAIEITTTNSLVEKRI